MPGLQSIPDRLKLGIERVLCLAPTDGGDQAHTLRTEETANESTNRQCDNGNALVHLLYRAGCTRHKPYRRQCYYNWTNDSGTIRPCRCPAAKWPRVSGGGIERNGVMQPSAELFDPATGQFTTTEEPQAHHGWGVTATLLLDGKVLVAGGSSGCDPPCYTASAELYDPSTGRFASTGKMTVPRAEARAVLLKQERCFLSAVQPSPRAILFSRRNSITHRQASSL